MNPFRYGCVVDGEYFCPRPALEKELSRLVSAGQNIVIQGERRMGKTSLVCQTVRNMRKFKLLYIDLLGIRTIDDFCRKTTSAILSLDKRKSFLTSLIDLLKNIRPTLSFDPMTANPTLSVDVSATTPSDSIETILDAIEKLSEKKKICVVFDEFQDMLYLDNANSILASLRSKIQFQPSIPYIFMGSVRNSMAELFSNSRSPFYKSAALFDIGKIDDEDFIPFLKERFKSGNRSIDNQILKRIIELSGNVSGDVQELCDALWTVTDHNKEIDNEDIFDALNLVFARESKSYMPILSQLTKQQLAVLKCISLIGGENPFSVEFIKASKISNASSIRKAILRLVNLDILYLNDGVYKFSNPFFKEWLKRQ